MWVQGLGLRAYKFTGFGLQGFGAYTFICLKGLGSGYRSLEGLGFRGYIGFRRCRGFRGFTGFRGSAGLGISLLVFEGLDQGFQES